jgi:hypothetical protein
MCSAPGALVCEYLASSAPANVTWYGFVLLPPRGLCSESLNGRQGHRRALSC